MESITEGVTEVGGHTVIIDSPDPALHTRKGDVTAHPPPQNEKRKKRIYKPTPKKARREAEIKNELYSPFEKAVILFPLINILRLRAFP